MISLSGMFDDAALGRTETMLLMYRIKTQIIILSLDACLQSNEIDRVDARVFSVTMAKSFKEGFCLTDYEGANFEEILGHVGVLFSSGIVKRHGYIVDFEAPREEVITLCSNARDEIKKYFAGGMVRVDEWLEIFVDNYQHFEKIQVQVRLKKQAEKPD